MGADPSVASSDPRIAFLRDTGWFDAEWYRQRCPQAAQGGQDPLDHYLRFGTRNGIAPNAWIDALRRAPSANDRASPGDTLPGAPSDGFDGCEIEFLKTSGTFDASYYLDTNPDVAAAGFDPLEHFCRHGWRELRKPRADFDVWWYWCTYLDPAREAINPLLHYALVGQAAGYATRPEPYAPRPGTAWPVGYRPRRICLFAGYDRDGEVDDYVVAYVRELSRHADVYYLADGFMPEGELDKLAPYTKGRWAERHGAYDFGSWSMLARKLVGWEEIGQYDELLLVNDSGYLLRSLDGVFAKMDAAACDWWGLQATKGLARTRDNPANRFTQAIPMAEVKAKWVDEYEKDPLYDFHVGSYFLVFRQPVLGDAGFRRLLDSVKPQKGKLQTIQKYEIGVTHYLIGRQFDFTTFIDKLYPFHPVFTENHFELVREGFPLLKRYLLSNNHYDVPDLSNWKVRIRELVPEADVGMFERNLLRVADDDKLKRSFSITTNAYGEVEVPRLLEGGELVEADRATPKYDHWWAFPVCAYDHTFAGNERAVFEEVKADPSIKKIILTRSKRIEVDGENVVVVPLRSPEGQYHLLRAKQVFVKHGPRINTGYPLSAGLHNFINLWHGIPLKRFGYAGLESPQTLRTIAAENEGCRAVVCSSAMDRLAMTAAFYPLDYGKFWCTGLPRNDFILRPAEGMPDDFREEEARLKAEVGNRKLVLYLPTFRNDQAEGAYRFGSEELAWLADWQRENEVVLGVREHMADTGQSYLRQLSGLGVLDLSSRRYPNIEVLYRVGAALISDYSSCMVDFLLTGKPVVSFAYDHERYANRERGLFYDLEQVLPGPVCRTFGELTATLDHLFDGMNTLDRRRYTQRRRLFFDHVDDANAWRLVKCVRGLYAGSDQVSFKRSA
jgi:CDP-glycerol glycerophosphotransferase (TagB/SpsB family)